MKLASIYTLLGWVILISLLIRQPGPLVSAIASLGALRLFAMADIKVMQADLKRWRKL